MTFSLGDLLIKSGRFGLLTLITRIIAIPKELIVAGVLNPAGYGIIGIVNLWESYTGFINLGVGAAAGREVPYLIGKGEHNNARSVQNIAVTSDLFTRSIPFVILVTAALCYSELTFKLGLALAAVTVILTGFSGNLDNMCFVRQQYSLVFKGRFINSFANVAIVLALIFWLKIYAVFIAAALSALITLLFFLKYQDIGFQFKIDWAETRRLIKPGIALVMLALIYNGFRLVDRTVGAYYLSLSELGMYMFALKFALFGITFLKQSISALSPTLYEQAGKSGDLYGVFSSLARTAVCWSLLAAMMIPSAQMLFFGLVKYIVPKYAESIPVFYVLSLSFFLVTTYAFANTILVSPMVNRQNLSVKLNAVGLGLNAVLDIAAVKLGYGMVGIAWGTIISQGLMILMFFYVCREYMFKNVKEYTVFMWQILLPLTVGIGFIFFHEYIQIAVVTPWKVIGYSFTLQVAVWTFLVLCFYNSYLPIKSLRLMIKSVCKKIDQ